MREIKFRAWDDKNKKWVTDDTYITVNDGWTWHKEIDDHNPDVILMQYTGFKDAKGVEIYEGDILYDDLLEEKTVVSWDKSGVWLMGKVYACNYSADGADKVIGNIYQNADLLPPPTEKKG